MVTVNPHLPIASKSMLVSTTAFGKGIVYQSAINELSTGKPCKDRGAGQQSGPIYGLQIIQSVFFWRMALKYRIPIVWRLVLSLAWHAMSVSQARSKRAQS